MNPIFEIQAFYPVILALAAAVAAGLMGGFALMKRMTLAGDAMSHIALPGLGVALLFQINPVIGAAVALAVGAVLIWKIEEHTDLAAETTIGVIFSAAIAVGVLVTPSEEIIEALFGGEEVISPALFLAYLALSLAVILFVARFRNQLILGAFNADLAKATGVKVSRLNLLYYLLFALTLILGLRFLGTLLVGALVIIPAATAKQLTETLSRFLILSAALSTAAVAFGYLIAGMYDFQVGPTVVSVAAAFFAISLFVRRHK
jgi:ABC-type Mn2+/Zn2+ transport system permease subunit